MLGPPEFQFSDCFPLGRKFDVGVDRIHVLATRMAHEGFPHFLHDAGFHEACVEGMAKIVETEVAEPGAADGCLPGGLDPTDWSTLVGEDQPFRLRVHFEEREEPFGEWDLAGLASGSL